MNSFLYFCFCSFGTLLGCIPGFPNLPSKPTDDTTTMPPSTDRMKNATDCGVKGPGRKNQGRIVGGVPARQNEIPWQVALLHRNGSYAGCGAALLSCDPVIVITAAHCLHSGGVNYPEKEPTYNFTLAFGAHKVSNTSPSPMDRNEVRLDVDKVIIHPEFRRKTHYQWKARSMENDIAVLKVKAGASLPCEKKKIWPACLPTQDNNYAGWNRTLLAGWGKEVSFSDIPSNGTLNIISPPVITDKKCAENIKSSSTFDPPPGASPSGVNANQLCTGPVYSNFNEGKTGCTGDQGSPLAAEDSNGEGYSVVGVLSFLNKECYPSYAMLYTEVGQYLDWIGEQFGLLPPQ